MNGRIFISGLLLAGFLLWMSFSWQPIDFWVLFPLSLAFLTAYAYFFEQIEITSLSKKEWLLGLFSGALIYVGFAFGKGVIVATGLPLLEQLESLYELVRPRETWHYLLLFIIVIPGEEWFWRGFVVKRLKQRLTPVHAALIGTLLYAGAHLFAGSLLLVLAALLAGFIWAWLYVKTNNLGVPIVSHLLFDLLLLIIFPLI
nr:type II CAAX endopeptidase family protein [Halalkalibacterium ligniniphilum]